MADLFNYQVKSLQELALMYMIENEPVILKRFQDIQLKKLELKKVVRTPISPWENEFIKQLDKDDLEGIQKVKEAFKELGNKNIVEAEVIDYNPLAQHYPYKVRLSFQEFKPIEVWVADWNL